MKKTRIGNPLVSSPYVVWSVIFIVVPLLMVAYYSFTDTAGNFTFEYVGKIVEYNYLKIFGVSILYAFIATVITLLIAYPLAYFMTKTKLSTQGTLMLLVMLPMWMNFLIRTYSLMTILGDSGVINSALTAIGLKPVHMINTGGAVILGMVYNYIPYMILPIYSVMTKLDNSLIEAAQDLGANRFHVIKDVIFPSTLSGVVSGVTMVFVPSVSTFYISQKLGGGSFALIGDIIEMQFQVSNNFNFGAALSLVLMILILICMAVMNKFGDTEEAGGVVA